MRNAPIASTWAHQAFPPKAGRLRRAMKFAVTRWVAWIEHEAGVRRALATLRSVDNHLLADMGLTRSHLKCAVRDGKMPPIETVDAILSTPPRILPVMLLNVGALTCWLGD